jgi:hypothetical protein
VLAFTIVKSSCFAIAALAVLTAGCASTGAPATNQAAQSNPYAAAGATPGDATSRPPRLTVGVSYPDTQLILPWFLNDIIDFVNYH